MKFLLSIKTHHVWLLSVLLVLSLLAAQASAFAKLPSSFAPRSGRHSTEGLTTRRSIVLSVRGGATKVGDNDEDEEVLDSDEEDEDEDGDVKVTSAVSEDEEEEEEEVVATKKSSKKQAQVSSAKKVALDPKMAKSALKATQKSKTKQSTTLKKVMSAELKTSTVKAPKKKSSSSSSSSSLLKLLHVPYIIRAVINPITLFRMTRSYIASLFNLDYVTEMQDQSQTLRSAMEETAKRTPSSAGGGSKKRKRSFKPGQSKSISDLPKLASACEG